MAKKPRRALVVGSGRAGLAAAAELASAGIPVLLVAKSPALGAQSARDHEGINGLGTADSEASLAEDAGRQSLGLADPRALAELGARARRVGSWLAEMGVPLARDAHGKLARAKLSGSSTARTLFVGASTGPHLNRALDGCVRAYESASALDGHGTPIPGEKLVRRLENWRFSDLVLNDEGHAVGVVAQNCRTLEFKAFAADGIILASGGYAAQFEGAACNASSLGAPLGAALRQGAVLANLEFLGPSPTVVSAGPAKLALPEWLRWLGARVWVTTKPANDPRQIAEKDRRYPLESRGDTPLGAAEAVHALLEAGVGPGDGGRAFLDLTHLEPERLTWVSGALSGALSGAFGLDLSRSPLPVVPCIHHSLGGLWVDDEPRRDAGESARIHASNLVGLYGAGEACHLYHGAHALAGNLALADLVGGQRAAAGVVAYRKGLSKSAFDLPNSVFDRPQKDVEKAFETMLKREPGDAQASQLCRDLVRAMAEGCGLERDAEGLETCIETLSGLEERVARVSAAGPSNVFNPEAVLAAELPDILLLSRAIVTAALNRDESRGAHRRLDREANDTPARPTFVKANSEGDSEVIDEFEYELDKERISISVEAHHGK